MRHKFYVFLFVVLCIGFSHPPQALAQEAKDASSAKASGKLTLAQAVMCEGIKENRPKNLAIAFSITIGWVYCFTSFDPVPERTVIYHKWFHRDQLGTQVKLSIHPPRWSTFSRMQLREGDKGPWRVEITDGDDNVLDVLRFSITD